MNVVKLCELFCPVRATAKIKNVSTGVWFEITGNLDLENGMFGVWSMDALNHLSKVVGDDDSNLWLEVDGKSFKIDYPFQDVDRIGRHIFKRDTTAEPFPYRIMFFFSN